MTRTNVGSVAGRVVMLTCLLALIAASDLLAQTTTGTVRGRVLDQSGAPVVAAQVVAANTETGAQRGTLTAQSGVYNLVGLQPGSYELRVSSIGYAAQSQVVRVLIGQTLTIDLQLAAQAVQLEGITVVGTRAVETRTSEVATNVTQEQIENLPQQDRNFLNFAGLAPGVTVSRAETNKQISAGGLPANKINVFIDGTSFKNDVLEGGVHGQDASRGNPFPQIAVREFRVITQNFKAEYQRAASAVVTAVTQSGTNEFQATGFVLGQNKGLVELNPGAVANWERERDRAIAENRTPPELPIRPEYERLQAGIGLGGPIIRDQLHYFLGYEGNFQNREENVALGRTGFENRFGQYAGTFQQPFRSNLLFGKLSYQMGGDQTLDLSYNGRFETDRRGFGGQNTFERAENVRINYNVATLQHSLSRGQWFNQAHVSGQRSTWNPTVENPSLDIGLNYEGIINIGARGTEQRFVQDRLALRNDLTYTGLNWLGDHVVKGGANVDFLNYEVSKRFDGFPQFFFRPENLEVPHRAVYGEGDPGMNESNVQFGAYVQTDWDVTPRLQLNVGVRWDAETNLFNNRWVTPDSIRQQLGSWVVPDSIRRVIGDDFPQNYFTRGTEDRPIYLGAFQPRLGFSFDLLGTGRTVLHGGFGVYSDREIWNRLIDERFRLQWRVRSFEFTTDPAAEPNRIPWRPEYLSRQGLEQIVSEGNYPVAREVFLLNNETRPSRTHQWNLGVRQAVRDFFLGAAYRGVRGYNILSWYCGTPHPVHGFCGGEGGFQGVPNNYGLILSTDEGRTWYDAFDLTFERPFTRMTGWGFTVAYTYADASRKGLDFFTLGFPMVAPVDWPRVDQPVERHRVNASAIVGLPLEFQLSSFIQLGSGIRYNRVDELRGWGPRRAVIDYASEQGDPFRQVDVRLQRNFLVPGRGRVSLIVEAINVFNHANYTGYHDLYRWDNAQLNPEFGQEQWWTAEPGRRLQIGLDFGL